MKTCGEESRVDLLAHEKRGPDCLSPNGANPNLDMTGSHATLLRLGTPNPATSFNNGGSYHMGQREAHIHIPSSIVINIFRFCSNIKLPILILVPEPQNSYKFTHNS